MMSHYNIEPIHIPRMWNSHADLLSQYPCLPASELPPGLWNAFKAGVLTGHRDVLDTSPKLNISMNTGVRLEMLEAQQGKDSVYLEVLEVIRQGVKGDALDSSHPVKALKLELLELQIWQ